MCVCLVVVWNTEAAISSDIMFGPIERTFADEFEPATSTRTIATPTPNQLSERATFTVSSGKHAHVLSLSRDQHAKNPRCATF